jgi:hypothetical protein
MPFGGGYEIDGRCGMGVGMFVDIKRWVLLYLYAGSGSFSHMPYLDAHGELDLSMRYVTFWPWVIT